MEISARNQLAGIVRSVRTDGVMAEVIVDVDAAGVTAAITRSSIERLNVKQGDRVTVIIKATEVMIGK